MFNPYALYPRRPRAQPDNYVDPYYCKFSDTVTIYCRPTYIINIIIYFCVIYIYIYLYSPDGRIQLIIT